MAGQTIFRYFWIDVLHVVSTMRVNSLQDSCRQVKRWVKVALAVNFIVRRFDQCMGSYTWLAVTFPWHTFRRFLKTFGTFYTTLFWATPKSSMLQISQSSVGTKWRIAGSPLLKLDLSLASGFALQSGVPEDILVDNGFVQGNVNWIPVQGIWAVRDTLSQGFKGSKDPKTGPASTTGCLLTKSKYLFIGGKHIPGWHKVVVVEHLDESLDFRPLGNLLLAHGCGHLAGVAINARDQSMAVWAVSCAIINILLRKKKCGKSHSHPLEL